MSKTLEHFSDTSIEQLRRDYNKQDDYLPENNKEVSNAIEDTLPLETEGLAIEALPTADVLVNEALPDDLTANSGNRECVDEKAPEKNLENIPVLTPTLDEAATAYGTENQVSMFSGRRAQFNIYFAAVFLALCGSTFWLGMRYGSVPERYIPNVASVNKNQSMPIKTVVVNQDSVITDAEGEGEGEGEGNVESNANENNSVVDTVRVKNTVALLPSSSVAVSAQAVANKPIPVLEKEVSTSKVTLATEKKAQKNITKVKSLASTELASTELASTELASTELASTELASTERTQVEVEASFFPKQRLIAQEVVTQEAITQKIITPEAVTLEVGIQKVPVQGKLQQVAASVPSDVIEDLSIQLTPNNMSQVGEFSEQSSTGLSKAEPLASVVQPIVGLTLNTGVVRPQSVPTVEDIIAVNTETLLANYERQVRGLIRSNIDYPKRAIERKKEGSIALYVVVNRLGNIVDVDIEGGSKYKPFVKAARKGVDKTRKLPPLPDDFSGEKLRLVVPVVFKLF